MNLTLNGIPGISSAFLSKNLHVKYFEDGSFKQEKEFFIDTAGTNLGSPSGNNTDAIAYGSGGDVNKSNGNITRPAYIPTRKCISTADPVHR